MLLFIDIETSGLDRLKNNMISLGAITEDGQHTFYHECRLEPGEPCSDEALAVNGFTRESVFDQSKPTKEALYHFFASWVKGLQEMYGYKEFILAGENIGGFDAIMLRKAYDGTINFGKDWPFGHRFIDLHSVAYLATSKSQSLDKSLEALGLPPEVKPHNALNGAKAARDLYMGVINWFRS